MATFFVSSGGSNTSPYDTWAKAATLLETALAATTNNEDIVVIQKNAVPSADAELSADKSWTCVHSITIISATNDGGSSYTPSAMGTSYWLGNSTSNRSIYFVGADLSIKLHGLTLRVSGTGSADSINIAASAGMTTTAIDCYFWLSNTTSGCRAGVATNGSSQSIKCIGCTFRFSNTGQRIMPAGHTVLENCSVSSAGSAITALFDALGSSFSPVTVDMFGCDWSHLSTLIGNTQTVAQFVFRQCKFKTAVVVLAAQTTNPTAASARVYVYNCDTSPDTSWACAFGYYDAYGEVTLATGIVTGSGAEFDSSGNNPAWHITPSSIADFTHPFRTPWISVYNEGTAAITPWVEGLRTSGVGPVEEGHVWSEWRYLATNNSAQATLDTSDSGGLVVPSTTAQASSTLTEEDWGFDGTNGYWTHKFDPASAITPAESGDISVRFAITYGHIYIDPQIRGLS